MKDCPTVLLGCGSSCCRDAEQLGLATGLSLDLYTSLPPSLSPLPFLQPQACSGVGTGVPCSELQEHCVPPTPRPLHSRLVVGASFQPTVSPREPGSRRCFAQCTPSYLPPPGAKKPGRLQAPDQFTVVQFCSASRLQKHAL